jgi:hypothetical protein
MKISLRLRLPGGIALPGALRRLIEPPPSRQLAPALVPAGSPGAWRVPDQQIFHPVFGRKRDENPAPGSEEAQSESSGAADEGSDPGLPGADELPPIPSAPEAGEGGEEEPAAETEGVAAEPAAEESGWSSYQPPAEPSPFSFEAEPERQDLPAWTPTPLGESAFPAFPAEPEETPGPWGSPQGPEVVAFPGGEYQEPASEAAWPSPTQDPVWGAQGGDTEATAEPEVSESHFVEEAAEATSGEPEPPAETGSPTEPVPVEEAATPAEEYAMEPESTTWVAEEAPAPTYLTYPAEEPAAHLGAVALVEDARAFPLPEGEILFRNLRAGFTDPARLLRHLAGEGHTGVLHVAAAEGRNTYVVLVDGYVVAVAGDSQGRVTTTNRVAFPNFPNSQDVLNVITYPREIARGLGLLLHAPVHFRGLGAMFVNLDGLRSYLSKHSASGGMVVASDQGTGVALFDDGRLVGAYTGNQAPEGDLTPLRELIKDLDAEIDVRMGGPKELDPIPLDTLLAGYPL